MAPVKVSVIMPAYNVERFIDEAIRSVLSQRGISLELLIGDDASADATWNRIENYRKDPRVRAWRFRIHRGAGGAGNRLAAYSKGRYLLFCDADDVLLPGHIRSLVRVLDRNPRVGVAYGDLQVIDERKGRRWVFHRPAPSRGWDLLCEGIGNQGVMIRRPLMFQVGGYRPDLPHSEDYEFFMRLSEVTPFRRVPGPPTYRYWKRPGSLSDQSVKAWRAVFLKFFREAALRRYGVRVSW